MNSPEDFDALKDNDGCPDFDDDADGVPDSADGCPKAKEDRDGFEDADGCPDLDNDGDGIPDDRDKCPNKKENINRYKDADGCPDAGIAPLEKIQILSSVKFRTGTDSLTYESFPVLDRVAKKLKAYPEMRVAIKLFTGYTVDTTYCLNLLTKRHAALSRYFITKGVNPSQLVPQQYSPEDYARVRGTSMDFIQRRALEIHRVE
jgi:outer membrane protein OmpA-like peptidoglycan-associated protein